MERKWLQWYYDSRQSLLAYGAAGIVFVLIVVLILFIGTSQQEKATLQMRIEAERSFNSVYMALIENPSTAEVVMKSENIIGVGIYSSRGTLDRSIGYVPYFLPSFTNQTWSGGDSNYGLYSYDSDTKILQYMRFARLSIALDAGALKIDERGMISTNIDFPEFLYVRMDGSSFINRLSVIRFFTALSVIATLVLLVLFISLYRSNQRFRETLSKQESLVSLGAAARTLTHEIKNPLSAMTIQVALLKKEIRPELLSDVAIIEQEIKRLTNLTKKVSDFLKNPIGNPSLIEIRSFLQGIMQLFSNPISFTPDSVKEAYIEFDVDRARSVFENLLKNAAESCTDRDPQVQVQILEKKDKLLISVLDRGDGLAQEPQSKFFDPFFTTKIHGSGIGLSISRQFLKARGGSIELSNRQGGGTEVLVELKAVPIKFAHVILKGSKEAKNESSDS